MNMNKKSVVDISVAGKKILLRCDFNVPLDAQGNITDDIRITSSLPTINYLLEHGAAVILCSHLGRPKGERNMKYSLEPVAKRLSALLDMKVELANDVVGESACALVKDLQLGQVILLENLRFHKEEEANDPDFAKKLASFADIYVNDAFGTSHRAHASTAGVADYIPAVCGFLIQKEIAYMGAALTAPKRPFIAILGGKKIEDKLALIDNLIDKCDSLLIVGGMSYTFTKALGGHIGGSLCDDSKLDLVLALLKKAEEKGVKLMLPVDTRAGREFSNDTEIITVPSGDIPDNFSGMDIGPETAGLYAEVIAKANTIIWNGPAGVFEMPNFSHGTKAIARAVAESCGVSIIGGGDSAAAIEQLGFADRVSHISTGGGAALEFLEGKTLPGIACLQDK